MAMVAPLPESCELPVAPPQASLPRSTSEVIAHIGARARTWLTSSTWLCPSAIDRGPDRLQAAGFLAAFDQGSETCDQRRRAFATPPWPWSG
jgi:hypothetical protein